MTLNLVSPGVKVREVDLTLGGITAANEQVGAIAGPFEKGPINTPILIETEQDLLNTFGKPISTDSQYEYWMSASNYLSYGGVLRVVRTDNSNLNNANNNGDSSTKIESYENYINNHQTATAWNWAARDPGRWANNLKVCTIDGFADQIITTSQTSGLKVGAGVTQSLAGRDTAGAGTTSQFSSGFLRGVITEVGTGYVAVKVVDQVTAAGVSSQVDYKVGGVNEFKDTVTESTTVTTSIGATVGTISEDYDVSITGITTGNLNGDGDADMNPDTDIVGGNYITVTGTGVGAGTTVVAIGASTVTVSQVITVGAGTTQAFTFSKVSTASTTSNPINVVKLDGTLDTDAAESGAINSATSKDWYNEQKMLTSVQDGGTDNVTIYWKSIASRPDTTEYAKNRNGKNDEIHVVVIDDTGDVTGTAGNIVEKFAGLSKAFDGKISPSENIYWKDYVATTSEYVYAGHIGAGQTSGLTGTAGGYAYTQKGVGNWNTNAQGIHYSVNGNQTYKLTGGENYSATGGYSATLGDVVGGYEKFKNQAEYDINFLIQGPSGGASVQESQAKANYLISLAELRKDCIACVSPHKGGVVNISDSDTQTDNIINYYDSIASSSYAVFDSGYKYVYDRFNNQFRYIALNSDTAGAMCRTSINQYSWFSPAGAARGAINSAIKLAYNPSQAQRDQIYPKRINPVVFSPGAGIILFGDRTGLGVQSAFDRINVRRLFLTIEGTIERAARAQLFEFNDIITRSNFVNIVEPYLRDVKSKRGITDFVVVCDESNNTPDIIDANQFKADIFIKPARSINFIGLTFVATRTGVSFEEVVGNV